MSKLILDIRYEDCRDLRSFILGDISKGFLLGLCLTGWSSFGSLKPVVVQFICGLSSGYENTDGTKNISE